MMHCLAGAGSTCVTGKSAMRFEKAACRNRAKLERARTRFPLDLEDVKFDQAVDILTGFDLAGNEIEQAEALPQEIVEEGWRVGGLEVAGSEGWRARLQGWRVGGRGWRVGGLEGRRVGGWGLEVGRLEAWRAGLGGLRLEGLEAGRVRMFKKRWPPHFFRGGSAKDLFNLLRDPGV